MRTLEVRLDWGDAQQMVGVLAERERRTYFEYDPAFLAEPLPISPFKLPMRPGLIEHQDREYGPLFGVFQDSLPDGWGLLLMDREFRRQGRSPATVTALDRLAYIGTRGMGALTYHPPSEGDAPGGERVDLATLAREAERVLEGRAEDVLPALRIAGGSPGGARPKVVVGVHDDGRVVSGADVLPEGYRPFLVKFGTREDGPNIGVVEVAYAEMARAAGIVMPYTRVFDTAAGRFFGAERFDRVGIQRLHVHTLGGMLHASHRVPSMDYEGFLRTTRALTRDEREVREAFRRMAFNAVAHNQDDHVKNVSYRMGRDGGWTLAPAYDLVFSHGPGGEHTMAVAGEAAGPGVRDMLRVADACDVDRAVAGQIITEVADAVAEWPRFAREAGVPRDTAEEIRRLLTSRTG